MRLAGQVDIHGPPRALFTCSAMVAGASSATLTFVTSTRRSPATSSASPRAVKAS